MSETKPKQPRFHPRLRLGQRLRLAPDGPLYRVARVTPGAAYLKPLFSEPQEILLPNGKSFWAKEEGKLISISLHAAVYPGGEVQDEGNEP